MNRPTTVRCIFSSIQFRHPAHDSKLGDTVFHCNGWPVVKPRPKVWVRWTEGKSGMAGTKPPVMWVGGCEGCDHTTQYWSWGATLGHMLEHQWIGCQGEKDRARDRRAKYAAREARLSCGGRTHGIMGEERRGPVVRRTDVPSDVPDVPRSTPEAGGGQAALGDKNFGDGAFQFLCLTEHVRENRPAPWQLGYLERGPF